MPSTTAKKHGERNMDQITDISSEPEEQSPHFNAMPVQIRGVRYTSMTQAAREIGVSISAISKAIDTHGHADNVGVVKPGGKLGNTNGRKVFELGNVRFSSHTIAAQELGITRSQIVKWTSPKATQRQREMLLSAVMRYALERDKV